MPIRTIEAVQFPFLKQRLHGKKIKGQKTSLLQTLLIILGSRGNSGCVKMLKGHYQSGSWRSERAE